MRRKRTKMTRNRRGRGAAALLLLVVAMLAIASVDRLVAANNTAPTGWLMANRDRARWAMGTDRTFTAHCSATNTLPATGVAIGDVVWGIVNIQTPGSADSAGLAVDSTITVTTNKITSSATPYTLGDVYVVFIHRLQADDR